MSAPARDDPRARVRLPALAALALGLAGCTVGPNYARPAATVPDAYRGTTAGEATTLGATAPYRLHHAVEPGIDVLVIARGDLLIYVGALSNLLQQLVIKKIPIHGLRDTLCHLGASASI